MSLSTQPKDVKSSVGESAINRGFWIRLGSLATLALVLRLLHVRSICNTLGTAQIHDSAYYHDLALMMLGRQTVSSLETTGAFANLGYPHVLKWLYAITPSPTFALVIQAMFGAITAVLTGLAGRDIFRRRQTGLWAAGLYACYAPAIFYDGLLLIPSLSAFLSASLAWLLCRTLRLRSWRFGVPAGLAIGSRDRHLYKNIPTNSGFDANYFPRSLRAVYLLLLSGGSTTCGEDLVPEHDAAHAGVQGHFLLVHLAQGRHVEADLVHAGV